MRATATATVSAPPARVWAVLSDHEGMARWAPGVKASLVRHGELLRNGVGAQRSIKAPLLPAFVEEVIGFEAGRRLTYRAVSGVPLRNYVGDVQLRPVGGQTEISYTISTDTRLPGIASVLAHGLLFALKRQVNRG